MASTSSTPASTQAEPTKPTRRRTPKTCGECRRLKLKCDRVFPCQSCVKRGCEGICPEGSLVSGRGSRYILANTEQLHEKIIRMAERIRDLEEALKTMSEEHARCLNVKLPPFGPAHPLLKDDLLLIKNQLELYGPDRSQLATKSDIAYGSDGSDGDHSRTGSEQPFSPTQLEALILGTPGHLLDAQLAPYSGSDNLNSPSQMTTRMPYGINHWPTGLEHPESYQADTPMANGGGAIPGSYLSAVNAMPVGNFQLRNYHNPSSVPSYQHGMGASAAHCSDGTQYLCSEPPLPQSEAELVDQMYRIFNMGRSSGV